MRSILPRSSVAIIAAITVSHDIYLTAAFTALHHSSLLFPSTHSRHLLATRARTSTCGNFAFINTKLHSTIRADTISSSGAKSPFLQIVDQFLSQYKQSLGEGQEWAKEFGFAEEDEAAEGSFYAIFRAFRKMDSVEAQSSSEKLLGLSGTPFYIPASLLAEAEGADDGTNKFMNYFHFPHLATALEEDFLDAQVGSTDNRKGWQVSAVSQPTGTSFDDARMTLSQVKTALEVNQFSYRFFVVPLEFAHIKFDNADGDALPHCTILLLVRNYHLQ